MHETLSTTVTDINTQTRNLRFTIYIALRGIVVKKTQICDFFIIPEFFVVKVLHCVFFYAK